MKAETLQPTDEAIRNRIRRELDSNFCVEAGAGTGKTRLMVDRIENLVLQGRAAIDEIVAITFTEKAAAELKARVRKRFEARRAEVSEGSQSKPLLDDTLARLDRAPICTIHSFASTILRERSVEAGVDPRFEVLDGLTQEFFFDQQWRAWIDASLERHREIFRRAISVGLRIEDFRSLAENFYLNRDIVPFLAFKSPSYNAGEFYRKLRRELEELDRLSGSCFNEEDKGYQRICQLRQSVADFEALDEPGLLEQFLVLELEIRSEGNQKNWSCKEECKRQKEICSDLKNDLADLRKRIRSDALQRVAERIAGFVHEIQQRKVELGLLDFQDLLLLARDLLRSRKDVREYFLSRYRYVLIDEFQDTDPLQVEALFFLAEATAEADVWTETSLSPGKLFLVGDPKQSIYRFRRADIEVYEEAKGWLEQASGCGGETLEIQQNFRSGSRILAWVNSVFEQLIRPSPDGRYSPRYIPIHGWPECEVESPAPDRVFEIKAEYDSGAPVSVVRTAEAAAVIRTIERIVREQWRVREGKAVRPVQFRDIVLLFPTYTEIQIYEDALKEAAFPYVLEGGKQYYQRQEISSLVSCLRAIDNPGDGLSVVGALHSIFFGISDNDLFRYFRRNHGFNYLEEKVEVEPVSGAMRILQRLHSERQNRPISETIQKLYEETFVLETLTFYSHLRQSISNLLKVVQQAREFERLERVMVRTGQVPVAVFQQFVRWLDDLESREVEEMDSLLSEPEENVIRLMSIHKAKGLEFPAVFLTKLDGAFWGGIGGTFVLDYAGRKLEYRLGTKNIGYFESPEFESAAEREDLRLVAERKRILYVAATRARDYLFLPLFHKEPARGYMEFLLSVQRPKVHALHFTAEQLTRPVELPLPCVQPLDRDWEDYLKNRQTWEEGVARVLAEGSVPSVPIRTGTSEETGVSFAEEGQARRYGDRTRKEAAERGSEVHRILERWDFTQTGLSGVHIDPESRLFIKSFLDSGLRERALAARRFWKEMPFSVTVGGELWEGFIDLVIEEDDGLVLVDYKTDDVPDADTARLRLQQSYREQGRFYRDSLERAGLRVKEVWFLFLKPGCLVKLVE